MIRNIKLFSVLMMLSGLVVAADSNENKRSVGAFFSNETIEVRANGMFNPFSTKLDQSWSLGGYLNNNNDFQVSGGLATEVLDSVTPLGSDLTLTAGVRGYMSRLAAPSNNIFGVGFGGGWRYKIAKTFNLPVSVGGEYYYAPEVLVSGESQNILDFDILEAQVDVTKDLSAVVGLRELRIADRGVDNNWHLGVRYRF